MFGPCAKFLSLLFACLLVHVVGDVEEESWSEIDRDAEFSCPPEDLISPCFCHMGPPLPAIHCSGVRSLKTLTLTLSESLVGSAIPYLKIEDCPMMGLPSRAFHSLNLTRLMISNSNLTYVAPDAFVGVESLMLLVLHNVMLFDFPADSLARLPSLHTLSLAGNKLSRLTRDDLGMLKMIRYFGLRGNRLAHIERGAFSSGLIMLSLSDNHLLSLNKSVRHMPYLETLYLEENRLTSVEGEFEGLFSLRFLYLANNLLRTLGDAFCDLSNLKVLELQYNSIYDLGDSLRFLVNLQSLNLSQNILFRLDRHVFRNLESLEILDLSGNHLTTLDGSLTPLINLISLDLSKNALYNFTFHEIYSMSRLKVLDLEGNQLSTLQSGIASTLQTISLQMLFISRNQLTDLEGFLHHFPNLEVLDVSNNLLQRLWRRDFEHTPRLECINVRGNPLVCDIHQLHVLHELESRRAEIEGKPDCAGTPVSL